MDRNSKRVKISKLFYRGAGSALVLALCLSALPLFGGQDQPQNQQDQPATAQQPQDQPDVTVQQSQDQPGQQSQDQPGTSVQKPDDGPGQANAPQEAPVYKLPPKLTVPAGTVVTVRVSQFLSSDHSQVGDVFNAELQQPIVVDGWVVARRGQSVIGRVAVAEKAGRVKGVSQLGVELNDLVLVDGQQLPIKTQLLENSGGTTKGRDAAAIGTTTGLGAAIGAGAGEGKGAAIGAGAGAVVGIAGVLLTRGRPTIIPPETVLTFRMNSAVSFSTERSQVAFRSVNQDDYNNNKLGNRPPRYAAGRGYPPPPYFYGGYYPWGYYPGPVYFGYYGYGRGFGRGGYRR